MAEQDAGRWEEWHYEDEKQGWAVPVVIGTSRPDYPLLHGNREAMLQAVADHHFAAVARDKLPLASDLLTRCDSFLSLLWHRYKSQIDWKDWLGMSDMEMQMFMGQLRSVSSGTRDALASLTENTGGER